LEIDPGLVPETCAVTHPVGSVSSRRSRTLVGAILAIIAIAVALGVWTIALLEVEVVPPNIGTCGAVLTEILLPTANHEAQESPTTCAEAFAPAVREAETVFWVSIAFDAFAIAAIIALIIKRRRIVHAAIAAAGQEVTPLRVRLRVARIGWVALATSLSGIALLYMALQTTGDSIEYAGNPHQPLGAVLAPVFVFLSGLAIVAAIALNCLAGTRGLGNRIIGVVGGLILLSPFFYMEVAVLLLPLQ
jgi:hypothetical protein